MRIRILLFVTVLTVVCACSHPSGEGKGQGTADAVYTNGKIYTVDRNQPWAEALAIKDGKFLKVGTNDDIMALIGADTEVTDLSGRFVMPGIHDVHVHPMAIGRQTLHECNISPTSGIRQFLDGIRDCAGELPQGAWLRGGQWAFEWVHAGSGPNKQQLDELVPDNPVFLLDSTLHGAWLNSMAMEILGITTQTPDPEGGEILRDPETGEPSGILLDKAAYHAMRSLPRYRPEQYEEAIFWTVRQFNQFGITGIKDALAEKHTLQAYADLDAKDKLSLRVAASLPWKSSWADNHETEKLTIQQRADVASDRINTNFVKFFLDGIPPFNSAGLLDEHNEPDPGELNFDTNELINDLAMFDGQGITVKMHATGPGAVRQALNAIEQVRAMNGNSGLHHEITHIGATDPHDIPRFHGLNVTAEIAPVMLFATYLFSGGILRSFHQSQTRIVFGSDWPAVAREANPWPGIEVMITGRDAEVASDTQENTMELIDLASAIVILTKNGADAIRVKGNSGMIRTGDVADFIVLDRNLFEIPVHDISETRVLKTVFAGKPVYESE